MESGGGGAGPYRPSAPSLLAQIVPNSASSYTVFHSVIFNSVQYTHCTVDRMAEVVKVVFVQEELARKRELPVPPVPKRSGVWARSNEDIPGRTEGCLIIL